MVFPNKNESPCQIDDTFQGLGQKLEDNLGNWLHDEVVVVNHQIIDIAKKIETRHDQAVQKYKVFVWFVWDYTSRSAKHGWTEAGHYRDSLNLEFPNRAA